MKIAVYFDLPPGGASRTMEALLTELQARHEIDQFRNLPLLFHPPILKRLFADMESLVFQRVKQKLQALDIDRKGYDLVLVSHDGHSQAPWILRFLSTPSVFLCQEPTRAYFEEFLKIDKNLPLLNRIYETINRYFRKNIEIRNARHASGVISNSYYSSESIFRAYGVASTPMYLGVDIKDYYPQNIKKANQVVVVGNNEPQKDLELAIKTVAFIEGKNRPRLIIAQPRQRDNKTLLKLAKKLKVDIEFTVGLSQTKMNKLYNRSKVTLAVAHLEPFGLSVIESLACGTPVLAVREGGFRETVVNGKVGVLEGRDVIMLGKALDSLLKNSDSLDEMGRRGVVYARKHFTWKESVATLEKIFYEIKN